MKKTLLLLSLFFMFCMPVQAREEYVAAFVNPQWSDLYEGEGLDFVFVPKDWNDLDFFLNKIKEEAGDRPIVIDIACHGLDYLYLQYRTIQGNRPKIVTYKASAGYLINHIENILVNKNVTVIIECCYGPYVFMHSMDHNTLSAKMPGDRIENHKGKILYPCYGLDVNDVNLASLMYLQWKHQVYRSFTDLRLYVEGIKKPKPRNPQLKKDLYTLFRFLKIYENF